MRRPGRIDAGVGAERVDEPQPVGAVTDEQTLDVDATVLTDSSASASGATRSTAE